MNPSAHQPVSIITNEFARALRACGVDMDLFRRKTAAFTDIDREAFWAGQLGARAMQQVAAVLADDLNRPELGFRLAELLPRSSNGIIGYLQRSAATLRHAAQISERFAALMFDYLRLEVEFADGIARLYFVAPEGLSLHPLIEDHRIGRLVMAIREARGEPGFQPSAAHFSYGRPASTRRHSDFFGPATRLSFGQQEPALCVPAHVLDEPLPGHDPALNDILAQYAEQMLARLPRLDNIAGRVEQEIAATLHAGRPSITAVARRLSLGERTLRRRLAEEGTSYQELVDQVRVSLLRIYSRDPKLTPAGLCERLGFESESAFRRASKRWSNRAPPA
jgi:AraC-like DNA-binding protein